MKHLPSSTQETPLAGDKISSEREPHGWYCTGCVICTPEFYDEEV